jgi:hypothetical protein
MEDSLKRFLSRLTYANVVSTLCLFLLLGGGAAFAATKLAKNSVGTKQIKNSAVTGAKIKNGAVTGAKIDLSSVGTVPSASNASHATSADHASEATSADKASHAASANTAGHAGSADSADTAGDAGALGGVPASGYQGKVMWARVDGTGTILSQSGGISLEGHPAAGAYYLHFPAPVAEKALIASGSWTPIESGKSAAYKAVSCGGSASGGASCAGGGGDTSSDLYVEVTEPGKLINAAFFIAVIP